MRVVHPGLRVSVVPILPAPVPALVPVVPQVVRVRVANPSRMDLIVPSAGNRVVLPSGEGLGLGSGTAFRTRVEPPGVDLEVPGRTVLSRDPVVLEERLQTRVPAEGIGVPRVSSGARVRVGRIGGSIARVVGFAGRGPGKATHLPGAPGLVPVGHVLTGRLEFSIPRGRDPNGCQWLDPSGNRCRPRLQKSCRCPIQRAREW